VEQRVKLKPTRLERLKLEQIRRDYVALGMRPKDIKRKVSLYRRFIVENRSVGI
jgi:hypothetical protein